MIFSKRLNTLLLVLLSLLNITMRFPISNHEYSTTDSFFIHTLATSISTYGCAKWVIHPFSFIGAYPLSYGSMYPYLLSGTSTLTNVSIENMILISSIILSLFGMLSMHLVAREVKNDDFFAFLVAFVFSISPVFFFYTNWTATARGPFVASLPFFIYLMIKSRKNFRYVLFASAFLFFLTTTHQLFYLIPIIISAYLISVFYSAFKIDENKTLLRKYKFIFTTKFHHSYILVILTIIMIFLLLYIQTGEIKEEFSDSSITGDNIGSSFLTSVNNLLINYIGKIGLNLFFGFLGLVYVIKHEDMSLNKRFILFSTIFMTCAIRYRYYTPLFYLPFLTILIGYGIEWVLFRTKSYKKINFIFVIFLIFSSVAFSTYMDNHWRKISTNSAMSDETYNIALFVKEKANGTLISNQGQQGQQINAVSGTPVIPFNIQLWYAPQQLIYDFEDKNKLEVELLSIKELLPPPDVWYSFKGVSNIKEDYQSIMYSNVGTNIVRENLLKYNIRYIHLDNQLDNKFMSYGVRNSDFIPSIRESKNKIYDSNSESIWCV